MNAESECPACEGEGQLIKGSGTPPHSDCCAHNHPIGLAIYTCTLCNGTGTNPITEESLVAIRNEKRFEELAALEDGWYDGNGEAPHPDAIQKAREAVSVLQTSYKGLYIYPMEDGGVQLEIDSEGGEIDIECYPQHYAILVITQEDDESFEKTTASLSDLVKFVTGYIGEDA